MWERPYVLQSLKYLPTGPLQKKFAPHPDIHMQKPWQAACILEHLVDARLRARYLVFISSFWMDTILVPILQMKKKNEGRKVK